MTKFSHPLNSYFILLCLQISPPALPSKRARPRTRQKQFTAKIDSASGVHWLSRRHLNPVSGAPPPAPDCLSTSTFQRSPLPIATQNLLRLLLLLLIDASLLAQKQPTSLSVGQ